MSVNKTVPDKSGDVEMKNLTVNETQLADSKSGENSNNKADPDNAVADGSADKDVEMQDVTANIRKNTFAPRSV